MLLIHALPSPLGVLRLATFEGRLAALDYEGFEDRFQTLLARRFAGAAHHASDAPQDLRAAVEAYFDGEQARLAALALEERGSAFALRVWAQLRGVGFGQTVSYATIAERIGTPQAARAVGRANGLNPIAIVTPCHRIIAASGALTGYAGGLWRKEWLLRHERAHRR